MSIDGYLCERGYKINKENTAMDRTLAVNLAIGNNHIIVQQKKLDDLFWGLYDPFITPKEKESNYYFTCSKDFQNVELIHIYDYGEGIEEDICNISENLRLAIIGKCMMTNLNT